MAGILETIYRNFIKQMLLDYITEASSSHLMRQVILLVSYKGLLSLL